jgi:exodeoxyribonuclease VII small subunit
MNEVGKYEKKKSELEDIVDTLRERGKSMSMSELLELAERGNKLSKECSQWLFDKKNEIDDKLQELNKDMR